MKVAICLAYSYGYVSLGDAVYKIHENKIYEHEPYKAGENIYACSEGAVRISAVKNELQPFLYENSEVKTVAEPKGSIA